MTLFDLVLVGVAAAAGAIASVAGFGVGSLLTPVLALRTGMRAAVAAVTIPHAIASAVRFWQLRRAVDWRVVRSFGLTSAAGGLAGAMLHGALNSAWLTCVFAGLLIFAGAAGVTGLSTRMRFRGAAAWAAGALSGFFGGLVGNQGGIRAAAMLGFDVRREAFVGTATMVALIVDAARLPAYLYSDGAAMAALWPRIAAMTVGVVAGTLAGKALLVRIPERVFRRVVGALILALGVWMGLRAGAELRGGQRPGPAPVRATAGTPALRGSWAEPFRGPPVARAGAGTAGASGAGLDSAASPG
jgi:uncharacterized membrane protein YfcA